MAPREEDGKCQENLVVASETHVTHKIERSRNVRVAVVATSHQVHMVRKFVVCLRYSLVPPLSSSPRRSVVVQDNISSRLLYYDKTRVRHSYGCLAGQRRNSRQIACGWDGSAELGCHASHVCAPIEWTRGSGAQKLTDSLDCQRFPYALRKEQAAQLRASERVCTAPTNGRHHVIGGIGVQTMLRGGTEDTKCGLFVASAILRVPLIR